MPNAPEAVLDTNVLYAALRSPRGASRLLLEYVLDERLTANLTVPLFLEYEEVLVRKRKEIGITYSEVVTLLAALVRLSRWQKVYYLWRWHVRDPEDAHVLEAAVAAPCRHLVTFNTSDFPGAADLGIEVLTPSAFLEVIH